MVWVKVMQELVHLDVGGKVLDAVAVIGKLKISHVSAHVHVFEIPVGTALPCE